MANSTEVIIRDYNQTVHNNSTVIASGSQVIVGFGIKEVTLVINVTATPTGTSPTLTYTIQEVDPGNTTTVFGPVVTSTTITNTSIQHITLPNTTGGALLVSWTITGTGSPTFTGVWATVTAKADGTALLYDATGTAFGTNANPILVNGATGSAFDVLTPDTTATGAALTAASSSVAITAGNGQSSVSVELTGTLANAGTTLTFQGTVDGTNWFAIFGAQLTISSSILINSVVGTGTNILPLYYRFDLAALEGFRVFATSVAGGDTITVNLRESIGSPAYAAASAASSTVNQGNQGTIAQSWYTELTNGTSVIGVPGSALVVDTPDITASGALAAGGASVTAPAGAGQAAWVVELAGTYTNGSTVTFQGTIDGTTWFPIFGTALTSASGALVSSTTGPGPVYYKGNVAGLSSFRVFVTTFLAGDNISATIRLSTGNPDLSEVTANQGLQGTIAQSWYVEITDGTNVIGTSTHPLFGNVEGYAAAGSALTGNPVLTGGGDGTDVWDIAVNHYVGSGAGTGNLIISGIEDYEAAAGRGGVLDPSSGADLANYANSSAPSTIAAASLSNTIGSYATLGGQFAFNTPASAETDYLLFAFQVPAGLNWSGLYITNIQISTAIIGQQSTTIATVLQWGIGINSTAQSLATVGTGRKLIGIQHAPKSANVGDVLSPADLIYRPGVPLFTANSNWVQIIVKAILGHLTNNQINRGIVTVDGFFA